MIELKKQMRKWALKRTTLKTANHIALFRIELNIDVSDDVTTPKAIRCAGDKIFWCFDISEPTSDL